MYIGKDPSMKDPIVLRPSILVLWEKAAADLRTQGATVVEVDFTPMHNYEADRPGTRSVIARELMPEEWWFSFTANAPRNVELSDLIANAPRNVELFDLIPYAYEDFLQSCNDPNFPSWRSIDASKVFPDPPGSVEARGKGLPHGYAETKAIILSGVTPPEDLPKFAAALEGVERLRKLDFEDWMISNKLDAVVFPANADVGNADSDVNDTSYDAANRNGVRFSNMNYTMRHLGIPSVSVSMGTMADTRLPVNLTFIGPAYSDNALLSYAYAYEEATHHRQAPCRVPPLADEVIEYQARQPNVPSMRKETLPPVINIVAQATYVDSSAQPAIRFRGTAQDASRLAVVRVYINGHKVLAHTYRQWSADVQVTELDRLGVADAQSVTVLVLAKDSFGNTAASFTEVDISSALSASTAPALHEAR
jgi:amidase